MCKNYIFIIIPIVNGLLALNGNVDENLLKIPLNKIENVPNLKVL